MDYVILAPRYLTTSAGVMGLHVLREHLVNSGQNCRIIAIPGIGDKIPGGAIPPTDNDIVIIPDCFAGNIFKAKNVVRYLMMYAGYFGPHTDSSFPDSELMYYYLPKFVLNDREPNNILTIPIVDETRFPYRAPSERSGTCYLAIKYWDYFGRPLIVPSDWIRITKDTDLKDLFSKVKKLVTFDNSAINLEAALAGVEVEYRFNDKFHERVDLYEGFDYSDPRGSYDKVKRAYFEEQIPKFIEITQRRFNGKV